MPWAGGNLRTRSAAARRPPLFADSGGPEVRKHVQSGIRPAWHPQAAARSGDHADAPRGEDIRHKQRRFRMPRLRLPPQQAGGAPLPSGCGVLPRRIRIREGGCRRHGLAARSSRPKATTSPGTRTSARYSSTARSRRTTTSDPGRRTPKASSG